MRFPPESVDPANAGLIHAIHFLDPVQGVYNLSSIDETADEVLHNLPPISSCLASQTSLDFVSMLDEVRLARFMSNDLPLT